MDGIVLAILLGVIQGITEFFPVSSSGHLIVASQWLAGKPIPLALSVAMHAGTLLAILIYFRQDWLNISRSLFSKPKNTGFLAHNHLLGLLIVGSFPVGIIGILFRHEIEDHLHTPEVVAGMLLLGGLLLIASNRVSEAIDDVQRLSHRQALFIGICQVFALIPGFSRSGATIIGARTLQLSIPAACRFSFLLGCPPMVAAVILHIPDFMASWQSPEFLVGTSVSFITGLATIHYLLKLASKRSFLVFGVYRFILATVIWL